MQTAMDSLVSCMHSAFKVNPSAELEIPNSMKPRIMYICRSCTTFSIKQWKRRHDSCSDPDTKTIADAGGKSRIELEPLALKP